MATQTGSIDLTATNGVKLYAAAGFASAGETYATKSELKTTADGITSTVESTYAAKADQRAWYAECPTAAATTAKVATIVPATGAFELARGQRVAVYFSATNTGAVGSLTLNVNGTGAKNVKYLANGAIANLPAAGYLRAGGVVDFVYDGTYWVTDLSYNGNNYDRRLHNNYIKAAAAITAGHIVCGTSAGYRHVAAGAAFDLAYPLLYASAAIASGAQAANAYEAYPSVNPATTGTVQGIAVDKMVWLKGSVSGTTFTCASADFLTCTAPTAADGFYYIPLGIVANDATTKMYFSTSDKVYAFLGGAFQRADLSATVRVAAAETSIAQNAKEIELRAKSSDVYKKSETYTRQEADAAITVASNSIKSTVESTYAAKADSFEYIVGTQTAETNAWTGKTRDASLEAGKKIAYRLPYAGTSSAATLNLTLSGGGTTGAKAIKMPYSTSSNTATLANVTTHWPVGSIIQMTYDGTQWVISNYNTNVNNIDRTQHSNALKAASANAGGKSYAVAASTVIGYVEALGGYQTIIGGSVVDLSHPLLWGTGNVDASATFTNAYEAYPSCTLRNNSASWSGTAYSMAFLVGTLSGRSLTVDAVPFASAPPESEDGKAYIPIGQLYSAYQVAFRTSGDVYTFSDGEFQLMQGSALAKASSLEQTAESFTLRLDSADQSIGNLEGALGRKADSSDLTDLANSTVRSSDPRMAWLSVSAEDGNPALVLGTSANSFHSRLTNSRMGFYEGSAELAYLSGTEGLAAPKATVKDELHVGGWLIVPQSGGNLALKYIGG